MIRDTGIMEDIQEAHFYHDDSLPTQVTSPLIFEKGNLHLNLQTNPHNSPRLEHLRRNNMSTEIHSPDFGFLKLASPDLEKMLLAFQAGGTDSPTGQTQMTVNASSVPNKHVHYSKGLAETLQDLHDRQDITETQNILPQGNYIEENAVATDQVFLSTDASGIISVTSSKDNFQDTTLSNTFYSVPNVNGNEKQLNTTHVLQQYPGNTFLPNTTPTQLFTAPVRQVTDETDTTAQLRALTAYNNVLATNAPFPSQVFKLDNSSMFGDTSSGLQPIDLEMQEMVKRERKKQRNRVASSKCRKRKLEKEAVLESTVKDLRVRNTELSALANALKQQICDLKQKVMDHVSEGCPITLGHVEDASVEYSEQDWDPLSERT